MWWVNQYLELQEWYGFQKSNKKRVLSVIMLVPNRNTQGYKEIFILFIAFSFGEGVAIIDWLANMKLYVFDIEESYKDTIIGRLVNPVTEDLLLHMVQCWRACVVDE